MAPTRTLTPIVLAALWMVGSFISFLSMAVAGRELSSEITTFQILFWRGLVGLVIILILLQIRGWHHARTQKVHLHAARDIVHFGAQFAWFYAIAFIPIAELFALEFTTPIWTLILAALILGEKITRVRVAAVALGFIGVLIILRPGISPVGMPQVAALLGALGFAFATYVLTRRLMRTDAPLTLLFWMVVIQTPLGLLAGLDQWTWPSGWNWFWVGIVGVGSLTAHYCMARALTLADANVVVPMDFARLPLAVVVGWLVYAEAIDIWVVVGAAIIFGGNYLNVRAEGRKSKAKASTD